VVDLLKGLSVKIEYEGKQEEKLYDKFVCWAKNIIDTKTASNAVAANKILELETYISDLKAGRIELTSERVDLEKELQDVNSDIETLNSQRTKEELDFQEAQAEMTSAITALKQAISVLAEATKDAKTGTFVQQQTDESEGFAARTAEAATFAKAISLSQKFLARGDAFFLRRVLLGEVPKADWKKLNRPADFKKKYKLRSSKIQSVLTSMLTTFQDNLQDASAKEDAAVKTHKELSQSKETQKQALEDGLSKLTKENGARGLSKTDAQEQVNALKTQITDDEEFIKQTSRELAEKKVEWKARIELRALERAAIAKAVEYLHSDDARDLFKSSLKSQGYSLLQVRESSREERAKGTLARVAGLSGDARLTKLSDAIAVSPMATGSHFEKVIAAIDTMIKTLQQEAQTDLDNKETCEKDRATQTRTAIKAARLMDEGTENIERLQSEIADIVASMKENDATIAKHKTDLLEASAIRKAEKKEFDDSAADDLQAKLLITKATHVLSSFYKDNKLMLSQLRKEPGLPPPPPPPTWDDPQYRGKTEEMTGVLAILEMLVEDITKDMATAKTAEEKSAADFKLYSQETKNAIKVLTAANQALLKSKGVKQEDVAENKKDRVAKHNELNAAVKVIKSATPGCEYITINYPVRRVNRHTEIDGLQKAKAILKGGEFDEGPDPDRELKPGDAFLQRRSK